jgi:hypothetical protein
MNVSIQDQLKITEVSALMSCIASICPVYVKFPLKIKIELFSLIVLEKYRNLECNIGNF